MDLFARLLTDSLTEFAYMASLAELRYSCRATPRGLYVSLGGFSHKLATFADKIAKRLTTLTFSDGQFADYKDKATRELADWDKEQPYQHAR